MGCHEADREREKRHPRVDQMCGRRKRHSESADRFRAYSIQFEQDIIVRPFTSPRHRMLGWQSELVKASSCTRPRSRNHSVHVVFLLHTLQVLLFLALLHNSDLYRFLPLPAPVSLYVFFSPPSWVVIWSCGIVCWRRRTSRRWCWTQCAPCVIVWLGAHVVFKVCMKVGESSCLRTASSIV